MAHTFNTQQQQIISIRQGKHLVLAPPGCGKTHILAQRIMNALQQGVTPNDMLCLTFTNRAARGMRNRVAQWTGNMSDDLFVGNIHRYCSSMLFANGIIASQSAIVDDDDIKDILGSICTETPKDFAGSHFVPNYHHFMMQLRLNIDNELLLHISTLPYKLEIKNLCLQLGMPYCRKSLLHIYDHLDEIPTNLAENYEGLLLMLQYAHDYENYKANHHIIDFDDILINAYVYLRDNDHQRYAWIQIDEVQDLSPMQLGIIDLLYNALEPHSTLIYLGDEQQAIFSFIGAKLSTIAKLKTDCEGRIHRLSHNFRAPKHLLSLYNDFAEKQLDVAPEFLPETDYELPEDTSDYLRICYSESNDEELANIADHLIPTLLNRPEENTAIIVPTNNDAEKLSASLSKTPHFKISGQDIFTTLGMKALLAHFNVINNEHHLLSWAHIFRELKVESSYAKSRVAVNKLLDARMLPTDLLCYEGETYLTCFCKAYQEQVIVVYDTETTGTDVFNDDIVQLAAFKIKQGKKIPGSDFEVLLHTDKCIPEKLGDLENPLIQEYATRPHTNRAVGLQSFIDYAQGCALCGHNIRFDNHILHHNLKRLNLSHQLPLLPTDGAKQYFTQVFDTLKLARLLFPEQLGYKLKTLIESLGLEGENSHLANDDIFATWQLMNRCYEQAQPYCQQHREMLQQPEVKRIASRLCQRYVMTYFHTLQALYSPNEATQNSLATEMAFVANELALSIPKLDYILDFISKDVVNPATHPTFMQQMERHLNDLNTYRETDLCESESMKQRAEKLFITTVHKAKGLEFDNVIITGAVEGNYPFYNSRTVEEQMEDARKFYVALTRAKKRIFICHHAIQTLIDRRGLSHTFARKISPFCHYIMHHLKPLKF